MILITHKIGNPNLKCHLILNNIGGRSLRIKNISVEIKKDGKNIITLPAQTYNANPNGTDTIPITSFKLNPENEWGKAVNCFNYFNREEQKSFKKAEDKIIKDISAKLETVVDGRAPMVKAEDKYVEPFLKIFNKMFIWKPGEYNCTISVSAIPFENKIEKHFRFTLFETDTENLRKYTKDYNTGMGVYFDSPKKHPGVSIQISEET